jgi:hypothetical protein
MSMEQVTLQRSLATDYRLSSWKTHPHLGERRLYLTRQTPAQPTSPSSDDYEDQNNDTAFMQLSSHFPNLREVLSPPKVSPLASINLWPTNSNTRLFSKVTPISRTTHKSHTTDPTGFKNSRTYRVLNRRETPQTNACRHVIIT